MGLKLGDISPTMGILDREGAMYDASKKGLLGVGMKNVADKRHTKVQRREEAAAAEAKMRSDAMSGGQKWLDDIGYKSGGTVKAKGMGKARSGKACKVY